MIHNRSIPATTVIPVLAYPDVPEAAAWLCETFGFRERLRIGDHRIQLMIDGGGAMVVAQGPAGGGGDSVMVRVEDVDVLFARAAAAGARIVHPPTDYPYGERQCTVVDPGGHVWTFTQSIADVDPADWGGELTRDSS
jgi:uncharacterized glyoxalase superfamily protein PhnB